MRKSDLKVASYVRDMTIQKEKFIEFDRMVREAKGKVDAVLVSGPLVLGDDYNELVTNLDKLADADLMLIMVPPCQRQPMANRN